jgi:hypothetical protein
MNRSLLVVFVLLAECHSAAAQTTPQPWYERLRFGGDFRSRYEEFHQDNTQTRHRGRLRLRLRVDTNINEDTRFHMQLASGDPGTPVATNQTFTDFFQPKPFNLDRVYMAYHPTAAPALTLGFGKFDAPQKTTQLLFDEDINFEGGWEQVAWAPRNGLAVRLGALQTTVNERATAGDSYMLGGYGEVRVALGTHSLLLSAADYGWGNPDQIAVASVGGPLESILTNRVRRSPGGSVIGYASRFNVVDVIAEATVQTHRPQYPLRLLANVARNTKASTDRDSAVWFEAEYGDPRPTGSWGAGYTYGWSEQDVSPSAFVYSEIPGTNVRAHILEASYVVKTGFSVSTTLYLSKRLFRERPPDPNPRLTRLHLAAAVRF